MKVLDHLLKSVRSAAVFNPEVQVAPACILWPDKERLWEKTLPQLLKDFPELLVLGDYNPAERRGPAIWLRCAIAGKVPEINLPTDQVPILYLPGASRQDFRNVESCSETIQPLVELQFRGTFWSQESTKDWTPLAFFTSQRGRLLLDVARDVASLKALRNVLPALLEEEVENLKGKRLDAEFFNGFLLGGDPVRDVLSWMNDPDGIRENMPEESWQALVQLLKKRFRFDPEKQTVLDAAYAFVSSNGEWRLVWERFCEAPRRYSEIPKLIRRLKLPLDLTMQLENWPQFNDSRETSLLKALEGMATLGVEEARKRILNLEDEHGKRRDLVWAKLGGSPLAVALDWLSKMVKASTQSLGGSSLDEMRTRYLEFGWQVDSATLQVLESVTMPAHQKALIIAIRSVYLPWLESTTLAFQEIVKQEGYPPLVLDERELEPTAPSTCVFFVDGLRFDVAKRLMKVLEKAGASTVENTRWAAIPTITQTGKVAASPVRHLWEGKDAGISFAPVLKEDGREFSAPLLRKVLENERWQVLSEGNYGDPSGKGWLEFGNLDHEGHDRGWKLAHELKKLLQEISIQVLALLRHGWKRVVLVTDHGWLYMPGGFPKEELSASLTESKSGRCASMKLGSATDVWKLNWSWNAVEEFATPGGMASFRKGLEFAHGGLSIQECLLPVVHVEKNQEQSVPENIVERVEWFGFRCRVWFTQMLTEATIDIRTSSGDPSSRIISKPVTIKNDNMGSLLVKNDEMEGKKVSLLVLDAKGNIMSQFPTTVGGEQ